MKGGRQIPAGRAPRIADLGSYGIDGHSLRRHLTNDVIRLISRGIENRLIKRTADCRAPRRNRNQFDDDNSAEQRPCRGIVVEGKMIDLIGRVSGFLPYAQTEILLRRRARARVQNFGLIDVILGVAEVELRSVRDGGRAGSIA
jgi:hypothetical protein